MFKFGQKEVAFKDFYRQRQITYIFTIDVNKVVVSDKVSCNNGKDCRYIVGYQVDEALIPLFIKMHTNIFSYSMSQYDKSSAYTMSLMFLRQMRGCPNIKRFGMRLSHSYLKNWQQNQSKEKVSKSTTS